MSNHRYIFEKGSKKHVCPECNKKRFVRYIDIESGNYLPEQYGKCDRLINCSYELSPYKDGYSKAIWKQEQGVKTEWTSKRPMFRDKPRDKPEKAFFPLDVFNKTLNGFEKNIFIQNLLSKVAFPFNVKDIEKVIAMYYLGTIKNGYRTGAVTFPFIDIDQNIRAVQVKQFDQANHTTGTDFLHSIIEKYHAQNNIEPPEWLSAYNKNDTKVSCLFGEHLLSKYPNNTIALVEAPKTAIYGTLYFGFPKNSKGLLWLAVYNLSSLNVNKCKALKNRKVLLFPDLSKNGKAFELWSNKANEIQTKIKGIQFHVSDLLEQLAPEQDKEQGKDIADYLITMDWRMFRPHQVKKEDPTFELTDPYKEKQPKDWTKEIEELETYFENIELPKQPIQLYSGISINDCRKFIETHIAAVKNNNGKTSFLPYLNRLFDLKESIVARALI